MHWNVPPAFENPQLALEQLGLEKYKAAVKDYYSTIGQWGVEQAQMAYVRWVARRIIREFETHARHFRRDRRTGKLIGPDELWRDGRLMVDLEHHIRHYQVRPDLIETTRKLVRGSLAGAWGFEL